MVGIPYYIKFRKFRDIFTCDDVKNFESKNTPFKVKSKVILNLQLITYFLLKDEYKIGIKRKNLNSKFKNISFKINSTLPISAR